MKNRILPILPPIKETKLESLSFIVVHFSEEYEHNILKSRCVHAPSNQLIRVDNRKGHKYDTLSAAIDAGLRYAEHELVAIIHEDVVLVEHWQQHFQVSLTALEAVDPNWGLVGAVGWDVERKPVGHWSDPKRYKNSLAPRKFAEVKKLDPQLLVFRQSSGLTFDLDLPSIHNIGRDLASKLRRTGRKTYAIDAPTIHKFADENGTPITTKQDSPKIQTRYLPANLAEWTDSNRYILNKWPEWSDELDSENFEFDADPVSEFGPPIILLSRGGSGSRLLSTAMQDLGVFLGQNVNASGDCMDMVQAVYRAVLSKYQRRAPWQRAEIVPRLRYSAQAMLAEAPPTGAWGFKLPESLLILPELDAAFPGARYVHLIRDPLNTCLRRTHMTARADNAIGRTTLRAAYKHCERPLYRILEDSAGLHMAYTTIHQLEVALHDIKQLISDRALSVRFEDALSDPTGFIEKLSTHLDLPHLSNVLSDTVDPERAKSPKQIHPEPVRLEVERVLGPLRKKIGYPKAG